MTDSNYGINLKRDGTLLGEITNLAFPEISTESVEKTNHASGGVREYIPSRLKNVAEFTVTLNTTQTLVDTINDDIDAFTVSAFLIEFPAVLALNGWSFQAFPLSLALQDSDAQTPDVLSANVTLRPTGAVTISGAF